MVHQSSIACLQKVVSHPKHFSYVSKPGFCVSFIGQCHHNEKLFCYRLSHTGQNVWMPLHLDSRKLYYDNL